MISKMQNVTFISKSMNEYTNKNTGELNTFYKALFVQDDSSPLEISVSEDVFPKFVKLESYDLELEISSFNRKFYCTVVDAVPASDPDFLSGELDIA